MSMCKSIFFLGICLFCLQFIVFWGSCSALLKYDECDNDEDCSGDNIVCNNGYCITKESDRPSFEDLISKDCTRVYGAGEHDTAGRRASRIR